MSDNKERRRPGFFSRLVTKLTKTRHTLLDRIREVVTGRRRIDDDLLEEFEEILLSADVGVQTTAHILEQLEKKAGGKGELDSSEILGILKGIVLEIVGEDEFELDFDPDEKGPFVILVVGVNGTGKSTTIGKLAATFVADGAKTLLVAADTFRAAAADQLEVWSERSGADIVRSDEGVDPASVVFEGMQKAIDESYDVVLIDTAGRLHTKKPLMAELDKINRVIQKQLPEAPHETVLVLDATTGQNAVEQCRAFNGMLEVSALVMTKLDGTAKGGVLVAVSHLFEIPIVKIGIGEGVDDLADFYPVEFVDALFGEDE